MKVKMVEIGVLLVIIGLVVIFLGAFGNSDNVKVGFFGLIGPIPFGFGNNKQLFYIAMATGIVLFLISLFFFRRIT